MSRTIPIINVRVVRLTGSQATPNTWHRGLLKVLVLAFLAISTSRVSAQVMKFQSVSSGGTTQGQATNGTLLHFGMAGGIVAPVPNTTGFFYGYATVAAPQATTPDISSNTTPVAVPVNAAAVCGVTVTDSESGVQSVVIAYRQAASGANFSASMPMVASGNNYTYTIPASAMDELGAEYRITATNGQGLTRTISGLIRIDHAGDGLTIPYQAFGDQVSNYRIVSVPLVLASKTRDDVFADDAGAYDPMRWRMYHYTGSSTSELSASSPLEPGTGYWLIVKNGPLAIDSGPGVTVHATMAKPFSISLAKGWTQIGNPYDYDLSWTDVQAANPGLGALRLYNGEFTDGSVLRRMEGGFVFSDEGGSLIFPVKKNSSLAGRLKGNAQHPGDTRNWQVAIELSQGNLTNRTSGFGMSDEAATGYDVLDGINMPRFFDEYLELNHEKHVNGFSYSRDIVPYSQNHTWTFTVDSYLSGEPVTLKWNSANYGADEAQLILWDVDRKITINMNEKNSYRFIKTNPASFKVIYGTRDYVSSEMAVDDLVLHPVFPNPASGDITVAFTMPRRDRVSIQIVDIAGAGGDAVETEFAAGDHEVLLNRGGYLSPGMYIVRVKSRSRVKYEKIMIE